MTPAKFLPAARHFTRLLLSEPLLLLPGDRFILRMFSPVVTIGGGEVIDNAPPEKLRRSASRERLIALAENRLAILVTESRHGAPVKELVARTGMLESEVVAAANSANAVVLATPQPWLIPQAWLDGVVKRLTEEVAAYHRTNPLQPGCPRETLRSAVMPDAPAFLLDAGLDRAPHLVREGEVVRLDTHKVAFSSEEEEALTTMETLFEQGGLAVPSLKEVLAKSGVEEARARTLLQILLRKGRLVRISPELVYHPSAIARLRELMASRKGRRFGVPDFKEWTGISRKYAIPLLEFLDRTRVTRRVGDQRIVL